MLSEDVARIFREVAVALELKGDNPFRIRAYQRAAQTVEGLGDALEKYVAKDTLTSIDGIGEDLASKIKEIAATGACAYCQQLFKAIPPGVIDMLKIPGLGPKTAKKIHETLKIESIAALARAAREGTLRRVEGIREKSIENILRGIELLHASAQYTPLHLATRIATRVIEGLKNLPQVKRVEVAGSVRRKKETIKDIDIIVASSAPAKVMEAFTHLAGTREVIAQGAIKASLIGEDNIQVDLRVVSERSFGSAFLYFTGSKEFNVRLRQLAITKKMKINEYGVFSTRSKTEKFLAGRTEEEIFSLFRMQYIPPQLREDRGEIAAALAKKLPGLVTLGDIQGDFHVHSNYSDGTSSIAVMAGRACALGYRYVAVTDHSQGLKVARGLPKDKVYRKIEEIRALNVTSKIRILCGTEVDITASGTLDYPDALLKEFDVVIAAVHRGFKQSRAQLTKRIVRACQNKYVTIIAHPTGGLIGERAPYEVDLDEVFKAAGDHRVALEINCSPSRLDLGDTNVMRAKRAGVKLALGSDSHAPEQMQFMESGVNVAQRGWLEPDDILNCMDIEELNAWIRTR